MTLKSKRLCQILLLAGAVSTGLSAVAASGYYRWTDDAGKVQFSQKPPADGRAYQFVRTSTGTAESHAAGESPVDEAQPATETGNGITQMQGLPPKDPEKCQQAHDNMNVLASSARIRAKGQDGEFRFLQPEEVAEQKKRAQEAIEIFCD